MVRPIMRDIFFLRMPSEPATAEDFPVADDLLDTLQANAANCVGMAANMIGVRKRIIVFNNDGMCMEMFNPEIIAKSGPYQTEEGCLSLSGTRTTTRYRTITVRWQSRLFRNCTMIFTGWTAQIIQHEIDHCNGIII